MARTVCIGEQCFEDLIRNKAFYVDKTDFISRWYYSGDYVTLITRPRRFGKTLTLDMMNRFFSVQYKDQSDLFSGLKVSEDKDIMALQGTMPVIYLSFANIKTTSYNAFLLRISSVIRKLFESFDDLDVTSLSKRFREEMEIMKEIRRDDKRNLIPFQYEELIQSISFLSTVLYQIYHKKVFIFLDEYDTPMVEAYQYEYWNEISSFMRDLFNNTFKTNKYLDRAIMTGITRVSKESMFSDMNNLKVISVLSDKYADGFGFTEQEVFDALDEYGLSEERENVKYWYDGFIFGNRKDIYNPWSITNYLDENGKLSAYWANSGSTKLISKLVWNGSLEIKEQFRKLLEGETIRCRIDEEMVYSSLDTNKDAIWSLLMMAGYLKPETVDDELYDLSITNHEVKKCLEKMVMEWFNKINARYDEFITAILQNDIVKMEKELNRTMLAIISVHDGEKEKKKLNRTPENFYHGLVLGMVLSLRGRYEITSDRESGLGRYDVTLRPLNGSDPAYVMEFKVKDEKETSLEETAARALAQIKDKKYTQALLNAGIERDRIHCCGLAFSGKEVIIREEPAEQD